MTIGKMNKISDIATSTQASGNSNASKTLESQLLVKQQNLRKLSTDSRLSVEEKEKQRQELQNEIEELKRKMEMLQLKSEETKSGEEVERIKKEEHDISIEEKEDEEATKVSIKEEDEQEKQEAASLEDVQKMFQQNILLKDEMLQQEADNGKKNSIRIKESEIHQDEIFGSDTTSKRKQLKAFQEKENFWISAKNEKAKQENIATVSPDVKVIISE